MCRNKKRYLEKEEDSDYEESTPKAKKIYIQQSNVSLLDNFEPQNLYVGIPVDRKTSWAINSSVLDT
jgi:hypothetical protein